MSGYQCGRCDKKIPEGGLYYVFTIQSVSGFDGIVDIHSDKNIPTASFQIERTSAFDLERDVFWEHKVVVCAPCRETLVSLFMSELMSHTDTKTRSTDHNIH
jgi:hypothetical protein